MKRRIAECRMLSTANISDGLDGPDILGRPHGIGPLWDGCTKIVGPAATLKLVPVGEAAESPVGAKFWLKVFNDLETRGVGDILIAVTPA